MSDEDIKKYLQFLEDSDIILMLNIESMRSEQTACSFLFDK